MAVQPNCPKEIQLGSWVSFAGPKRSGGGEALGIHQGQRPYSATTSLQASRRPRHSGWMLCSKRDGGSRFDEVEGNERTLLAGFAVIALSSRAYASILPLVHVPQ